jgi:hypothetical protein
MGTLKLEFPLPEQYSTIKGGKLYVDLGNNVRLITDAPSWLKRVNTTTIQLVLDVEGSPHNDKPSEPPIK